MSILINEDQGSEITQKEAIHKIVEFLTSKNYSILGALTKKPVATLTLKKGKSGGVETIKEAIEVFTFENAIVGIRCVYSTSEITFEYASKLTAKNQSLTFVYNKASDSIKANDPSVVLEPISDNITDMVSFSESFDAKKAFWKRVNTTVKANIKIAGSLVRKNNLANGEIVEWQHLAVARLNNSMYVCRGDFTKQPTRYKYDKKTDSIITDRGVLEAVSTDLHTYLKTALVSSIKQDAVEGDLLVEEGEEGDGFEAVIPGNKKFPLVMLSILENMINRSFSGSKLSVMLGGDPGTGKTSTVRSLGRLTGLPVIVIEAPHIVEEHLIKIPFLTITNGVTQHHTSVTDKDVSTYANTDIDFSESALITAIKAQKRKYTFKELEAKMIKSEMSQLFMDMSGYIAKVYKSDYQCILFIDEFYRAPINIVNILRTTMNGFLGSEELPKSAYVMYATNLLSDDGIQETGLTEKDSNNQFLQKNLDTIPTEDFFDNLKTNFFDAISADPSSLSEADAEAVKTRLPMKPIVFNEFLQFFRAENEKQNLEGEDDGVMLYDHDAGIRLSPRRIKQIILTVNSAVPVKSVQEAKALLAYVSTNCRDYENISNDPSFKSSIMKLVVDIIKKASPSVNLSEVTETSVLKASDWKDEFDFHLQTKIKLGTDRTNVTVISGLPGIAKTTYVGNVAANNGMNLIVIDGSTLNPDDVMGLTKIDQVTKTVSFSRPPLYDTIMLQYNKGVATEGVITATGRYKHILLLDEINRVKRLETYNSLRALMLEGKFNEKYRLPDDVMVVSAINPTSMAQDSITQFTNHVKDVMDIINAAPNYDQIREHINTKKNNVDACSNVGAQSLSDDILTVLKGFFDIIRATHDEEGRDLALTDIGDFYIAPTEDLVPMYISPREIDEIVSGTISNALNALEIVYDYSPSNHYTKEEYGKFESVIGDKMFSQASQVLTSIMTTYKKSAKEVYKVLNQTGGLRTYIETAVKKGAFSSLSSSVSASIDTMSNTIALRKYTFDETTFFKLIPYFQAAHKNGDILTSVCSEIDVICTAMCNQYPGLPERIQRVTEFATWLCDNILDTLSPEQKTEFGSDFYERILEKLISRLKLIGSEITSNDMLDELMERLGSEACMRWATVHCQNSRDEEYKEFVDVVLGEE